MCIPQTFYTLKIPPLTPLQALTTSIYYQKMAVTVMARLPQLISKQTSGNTSMIPRVPRRPFTM